VLATCHRTEFYLYGDDPRHVWSELRPVFARLKEFDEAAIPAPDALSDSDAARHLFRVASSVESIALGEDQILSQVKDAHELLLDSPAKSPVLDRLFRYAIRTGKMVRTETGLCEGAVSISSAAVNLARKIFGRFDDSRVLLVGAGETAAEAGTYFEGAGASDFTIVNRGRERGAQLAEQFDGIYRPLGALDDACQNADIVVVATGSADHLLTHEMMRSVMRARRSRAILVIDISNPRNVDPRCAELGGVYLYNIDDLKNVVESNLRLRMQEVPKAEAIIEDMVYEWDAWVQTLRVRPTIATMARFFESMRQQELERVVHKVDDEEYERLEQVTKSLTKKLLHNPIMHLRSAVEEGQISSDDLDLVWDLFDLHSHINRDS
jgi:glutamyl-tRNA reductase